MIDNFELGLASIPLVTPVLLDRSGQPITGSTTIVAEIRRVGTSDRWDFNDNTFKTSGWTTRQGPLAQVDAALDPGVYERAAGWVATAVVAGVYLVTYRDTLGLALPASEAFRLGGPAEAVITKLDVTTGSRAAAGAEMALVNDAITAAKIATNAIDGDALAADAVTKIQVGLATTTDVTAARDHIEAYGDAAWATATGFASPADLGAAVLAVLAGITADHGDGSYLAPATVVLTDASLTAAKVGAGFVSTITAGIATTAQLDAHALAIKGADFDTATDALRAIRVLIGALPEAPSAVAIRDAVWADDDDAPVAGTRRWEIWRMSQWITETNPKKIVGQNLVLYTPGLGAVLATILLKDAANNDIEPGAGEPAQYLP